MKSEQPYTAHKKESNTNNLFVFLLLIVVSTVFLLGCSKDTENVLNNVSETFLLDTTPDKLLMSYTIRREKKDGNTTWTGEVNIAVGKSIQLIFSLAHKSSVESGDNYKHIFEDTKNNKIVFTTDSSFKNPVIVKNDSSLTGYTFS